MTLSDSIYNYRNRAVLLDKNVRVLDYLIKDLKAGISTSSLIEVITKKRRFPSLTRLDLTQVLLSLRIRAIPCTLTLSEVIRYGNNALLQIKDREPIYVYVTNISPESIEYFHPAKGNCLEDIAQFEQKWLGEAIIGNPPFKAQFNGTSSETDNADEHKMAAYRNEIRHINNFLTPDECDRIISFCEKNNLFNRSQVTDINKVTSIDALRTSYSAFLHNSSDPLFSSLIDKAAALNGRNISAVEGLQCVRYCEGQEFKFHFDSKGGNDVARTLTFLVYLNDNYKGGETFFPIINYKVVPKTGRALIFQNLDESMQPIIYSAHAGLPVDAGTKYALNIWMK